MISGNIFVSFQIPPLTSSPSSDKRSEASGGPLILPSEDGASTAAGANEVDSGGGEDQFVRAMGNFGLWQCCLFLSLGLAMFPGR